MTIFSTRRPDIDNNLYLTNDMISKSFQGIKWLVQFQQMYVLFSVTQVIYAYLKEEKRN